MVLVFSPFIHPKLHFVLSEIFGRRAGIPFQITSNEEDFHQSDAAFKINYSEKNLTGIPLYNSGWLNHNSFEPDFKPAFSLQENLLCLFPETDNKRFDLFATCFWLLSRYEEYQHYQGDAYGRFCLKDSCLPVQWATENFLDTQINKFLKSIGLQPRNEFRIIPTADIDIAFKYLARPWPMRFAACLRDLMFHRNNLVERRKMMQDGKDPYDVFDWLCNAFHRFPDARIFWQMNRSRNGKDRQVPISQPLFLERLKECSTRIQSGIHPSWDSNRSEKQFLTELNALEKRLEHPVQFSRQHFLACSFPQTFRNLNNAGILWDYTLGWAEQAGFRAGTAWPFGFYDVILDRPESLAFIPSCIMDVSCRNYMALNPAEAALLGCSLREKARREGGVFCFIVHNESMSETGDWHGWRQVAEAWMS
jgi:hypothetical protein